MADTRTLTAAEAFGNPPEPTQTLADLVRGEPPAPIMPSGVLNDMEREHRLAQVLSGLDDLLGDVHPLLSADDRRELIADFEQNEISAFLHGNYRRQTQDPEPAESEEREHNATEGGET